MPGRETLPPSPVRETRSALVTQLRCLEALMVRDMMMRYGRGNLGFVWLLVEPMILTTGVLLVWSAIKTDDGQGVGVVELVASGYVPLTLWRHMTNGGIFLLRRNASLLYHRHVTLLDTFLARMILEFIGTTAALIIVFAVLIGLELMKPPVDYGMLLAGWLAMAWLSFGAALVITVLTEHAEVWEKFIGPFQYLMLPLSGCFFMVDWLPSFAQALIWYNPTSHCFEAFRAGLMGDRVVTHFALWYPMLWGAILTAFGLKMLDVVRDRLHLG